MKNVKRLGFVLVVVALMSGAAHAAGGKQKPPKSNTSEITLLSIWDVLKGS